MKRYNLDNDLQKLYEEQGAFFAFSKEQLMQNREEGVTYSSMGMGLICPHDNCKELAEKMNTLFALKKDWELANNSKRDIIWYELSNHEAQITGDIEDVVELMKEYGITEKEVEDTYKEFFSHCREHDLF